MSETTLTFSGAWGRLQKGDYITMGGFKTGWWYSFLELCFMAKFTKHYKVIEVINESTVTIK